MFDFFKKQRSDSLFLEGIKDCIPTVLAYISIGITCGVVSSTCNMSPMQVLAMSTFIYTGSSQFIISSMILSQSSIVNIVFTVFLMNLRYVLISASIAPYLKKNSFFKNLISGFLLTDETFALETSRGQSKGHIEYNWMLGLSLIAYLNWIAANFIGSILGNLIYDYKTLGLDFALPAMFVGLLISSIKSQKNKRTSLSVIIFTIVIFFISISFISVNSSVLISAILASALGVVIDK